MTADARQVSPVVFKLLLGVILLGLAAALIGGYLNVNSPSVSKRSPVPNRVAHPTRPNPIVYKPGLFYAGYPPAIAKNAPIPPSATTTVF
jgi:hypothetical protein